MGIRYSFIYAALILHVKFIDTDGLFFLGRFLVGCWGRISEGGWWWISVMELILGVWDTFLSIQRRWASKLRNGLQVSYNM